LIDALRSKPHVWLIHGNDVNLIVAVQMRTQAIIDLGWGFLSFYRIGRLRQFGIRIGFDHIKDLCVFLTWIRQIVGYQQATHSSPSHFDWRNLLQSLEGAGYGRYRRYFHHTHYHKGFQRLRQISAFLPTPSSSLTESYICKAIRKCDKMKFSSCNLSWFFLKVCIRLVLLGLAFLFPNWPKLAPSCPAWTNANSNSFNFSWMPPYIGIIAASWYIYGGYTYKFTMFVLDRQPHHPSYFYTIYTLALWKYTDE